MIAALSLFAACQSLAPVADPAPPPPVLALDVSELRAAESASLTLTGAPPGADVAVFVSTADSGAAACPPAMRPACLDLYAPASRLVGGRADAAGRYAATFPVPAALARRVVHAQAVARVGRYGAASPVVDREVGLSWCYSSQDCAATGEVCSVELGACESDPSCPACDVCTGSCESAPCASTAECAAGSTCSTERGVCDGPPGCTGLCPDVCYGTCEASPVCYGDADCAGGQRCTVSDGVCDPDPTCPACAVCTGTCVDDALWCASTATCPSGTRCSTEAGDCLSPPGCGAPGTACPDVCYGTCGGGAVR